jgi:asparagine synthetase B (glutamine-hydrolysing)
MNVLFGSAGNDNKHCVSEFTRFAKKNYSEEVTIINNDEVSIAKTKDNNSIIEIVENPSITLVFYGYIYKPIKGWGIKSSPLDNQKVTAEDLLNSYKSKGSKFLEHVYGHYCVIVHDKKTKKTLLFRDPFGQNDLFYYKDEDGIIFSNKVSAIYESAVRKPEINRSIEDFFLIYGFYPFSQTAYKTKGSSASRWF